MRICSGAGCLRAVEDTVRFCDECKPTRPAVVDDGIRTHSTAYDADMERLNASPRWRTVRGLVVRKQPICVRCDRNLTEIVDHIVPALEAVSQARASGHYLTDKWAGYFLVSNLQGLCRPCHWVKTNEDKLHTGPWPDAVALELSQPKRRFAF